MPEKLTDLEAIVLGVIRRLGPCTAYQVHQVFLKSPSLHFSGSAGAIYPLVARLVDRDLIAGSNEATGRRKHKLLSLTRSGSTQFRRWIHAFDLAADAGFDPARARISVWSDSPHSKTGRDYLAGLVTALRERLESVRSQIGSDEASGMSLDLARELEVSTLEAKIERIEIWLGGGE